MDHAGVGLTRAQMEVAREQGTAWWLYGQSSTSRSTTRYSLADPNPAVRMTGSASMPSGAPCRIEE